MDGILRGGMAHLWFVAMHVQIYSELKQAPVQCNVKDPILEALRSGHY